MPADGGGIKQNLRALHGGEAGGFGIPLVPANEHADFAEFRLPGAEAKIAGREIKFFVEQRVIGNVHLAIDAKERAIGIDDGGGVVVEAGGALLEERGDDDDAMFARDFLERRGAGAGDGFGELEIVVVFALTEILGAEEFLGANDLRALPGGALCKSERFLQVGGRVGGAGSLQQAKFYGGGGGALHGRELNRNPIAKSRN